VPGAHAGRHLSPTPRCSPASALAAVMDTCASPWVRCTTRQRPQSLAQAPTQGVDGGAARHVRARETPNPASQARCMQRFAARSRRGTPACSAHSFIVIGRIADAHLRDGPGAAEAGRKARRGAAGSTREGRRDAKGFARRQARERRRDQHRRAHLLL